MKLDDLKPSEQLDKVLECLLNMKEKRVSTPKIRNILKTNYSIDCEDKSLQYILDKLYKDEFVDYEMATAIGVIAHAEPRQNNTKFYAITFEGKTLLEIDSGYTGRLASENANIVVEKNNEKYLRYGAVGAAFGSVFYLVWDIVKFLVDHDKVHKVQVVACLFLLLLSMLVYQLVRKLP